MTQEALAQKLGVTNQAVSKWEGDRCCPDIMLLPALADALGISLDTLFGRTPPDTESCTTFDSQRLPWEDNNDLHAVCFQGHRIVDFTALSQPAGKPQYLFGPALSLHINCPPVKLHFSGRAENIHSAFSVSCLDTVIKGNITAGESVECNGDVGGSIQAGNSITCRDVRGNVRAVYRVECGNVEGDVTAERDIQCGNISGNVNTGGDISCGNVGKYSG